MVMAALVAAAGLGACGDDGGGAAVDADDRPAASTADVAEVASWKTWVLASPGQIAVPPPPAEGSPEREAELDEVRKLAQERTAEVEQRVARWSGAVATEPWTRLNLDFVAGQEKNPPLSSRNYGYVHVAMYDAVVAAYHWKEKYGQEAPEGVETLVDAGAVPSYPSEHAAIAGAASKVLAHLYPSQPALRLEEMAEEAAESRVAAGVNTRSDVEAGLALGRAVADAVIERARTDGAERKWDGKRPAGIGNGPQFWEPPPGTVANPTEPLAGTWKTWVLTSGDQLRPPPPPAFGTPEFRAAAEEVVEVKRNLTEEQKRIAKFWEGAQGTPLPAGILNELVLDDVRGKKLSVPEAARVFALVNIAMHDGGISVWDAKFAYWNPRPENGIRDLGLDPSWTPHLPTPRFPAYPSGSAGYAGAVEAVMTALFPAESARFKARAEEQAISRVYAGIHWRYDAKSLEGGRELGRMVVEAARI